jgi:hypothetical protein
MYNLQLKSYTKRLQTNIKSHSPTFIAAERKGIFQQKNGKELKIE